MTIADRIRQVFTEPDGITLCPVRVIGGIAIAGYHGLVVFMVAHQHVTLGMTDCGLYLQHMTIAGTALGVGVGAKSVMKGDASQ